MKKGFKDGSIEADKSLAYLAYIGILFLVPLLTRKKSAFVQLHAKQGLFLFVGLLLGLVIIPTINNFLGWLIILLVVGFSLWGIWGVSQGKKKKLPMIGVLSEKIKFDWE
ncbi:MAG TPA: hypothetical protein GX706_03995 [Candidatus Moranbacteria bacterium]|nr:hypothetical protein [Candidatus Moranbacteria bacterium]